MSKLFQQNIYMHKTSKSFGFTAFLSIIIDGRDSAVTAIINESTAPGRAPFASMASAMGMVPKMFAYMGTPHITASTTPGGLRLPKRLTISSCGSQLCIYAPMPTPTST